MIQNACVSMTLALESFSRAINVDAVHERDKCQYALCAETWCRIVRSCTSEPLAMDLRRAINFHGLYSCIADADNFAKNYLADVTNWNTAGLFRLWQAMIDSADVNWFWDDTQPMVEGVRSNVNACYACQMILRFPKRFTVVKPDTDAALQKWKSVHKEVRRLSHSPWLWPGATVIREVRAQMREILIPKSKLAIKRAIKSYESDWGTFSGGSAFYPGMTPATSNISALKYGWAVLVDGDGYYNNRYDLPLCSNPNGRLLPLCKYKARVMAVPKDYETSRMIAPETPTLNREASRVRRLLLELTSATGALSFMPPEDQSLNRDRACQGSFAAWLHRVSPDQATMLDHFADKWYATIDLSHASDSISRPLFFAVLPAELHNIVRCALSDALELDGKDPWTGKPGLETCTPYLLATSGSVLTPILQSCFYLAICRYACDLCGCTYDNVTVYNDDIVCSEEVFETVCQMLTCFGLTVNEKKTFHGTNPFRESCGGEYVAGVDVTGKYWPRKAIKINCRDGKLSVDDNSLATLIALQHKLYKFVYVREIIDDIVTAAMQTPTYSPVHSDTEDLWADFMDDYCSMTSSHWCQTTSWKKPDTTRWSSAMKTLWSLGSTVHEHMAYYTLLERGPVYIDDELCSSMHLTEHIDSYMHSREVGSLIYKTKKPVIR